MTGTDILAKFAVQVDDSSELSTAEGLDLANDVYEEVCNDRDWEWLRAVGSGTTSTSVPYVALPSDFKYIIPNKDSKSVVFVGTDYKEYTVIPFSERREHRNEYGYCYIDPSTSRIVFTLQPTTAESIEFDYIKVQTDITASTSPLFRSRYHAIIAFGMAAKFSNIEQIDKARYVTNFQKENQDEYNKMLTAMAFEDSKAKLAI